MRHVLASGAVRRALRPPLVHAGLVHQHRGGRKHVGRNRPGLAEPARGGRVDNQTARHLVEHVADGKRGRSRAGQHACGKQARQASELVEIEADVEERCRDPPRQARS